MKRILTLVRSIFVGALVSASSAQACDLCAVYASLEAKEAAKGWSVGIFEQYTHFGTLREEGERVSNPLEQQMNSSITQAFVGYQFSSTFGIQANVPYIRRAFRRAEGGVAETGSESGLGDSVLLARWRPVLHIDGDSLFAVTLLGGIKLPTGSSDRIAEELAETPEAPGEIASGIHGHDLALGSGSTDGLLGVSGFWRYRRAFANASMQYTARSRGDFHYRYADDLNWSFNPGVYLDLSHENTFTAGVALSGEHKGQDDLAGEPTDDTAIDAVYLGPQITYSRGASFYADFAADFPLRQRNSALQEVADYRIRLAITWRP